MKGFPNQVADLKTLENALQVIFDLSTQGQDPGDDGVYGEALIRRKVLRTSHTPIPIDEYLEQQKAKKRPSDQSYRTRARGLREIFRILGLIDDAGMGVTITLIGHQIMTSAGKELTDDATRLWRSVIINIMHDGGDGEFSHPYQVLLRLVAKLPGITRSKCALALEARNDSEDELERIMKLAEKDEAEIMDEIEVSRSTWDNAKKILPGFAEQLGDVQKSNSQFFLSDAPGIQKSSPGEAEIEEPNNGLRRPKSSTAVTSNSIAKTGTLEEWEEREDLPEVGVTPEMLKTQKTKLRKRLVRHNMIVQKLAKELEDEGAELFENPFDCLACFTDEGLLVEVKS